MRSRIIPVRPLLWTAALMLVGLPLGAQKRRLGPVANGPGPVLTADTNERTNAPVAPDAIYVARGGALDGLSIIDLNGFGQGTGDPSFNIVFGPGSAEDTKFPFNPNVGLQGSLLIPPLAVGTSTFNGGSSGVFSLTKNSSLEDRLVKSPRIGALSDMMLGQPLDRVLNNGLPFGCQSGGGNLCAATPLQILSVVYDEPSKMLFPSTMFGSPIHVVFGGGNPISFAPHPNPPPIQTPLLCVDPEIPGQEPTSIETPAANLLVAGDFLGQPGIGVPPSGLRVTNTGFFGPSPPSTSPTNCESYMMRQQLGHFLYAVDAERGELLVYNSNTLRLIERFSIPGARQLAMGPNVDFLAVTSQTTNEVVFLDIDPTSSTFHQIVMRTPVGDAPNGVAWDPGNEDILVCNEGDGTVSILSTFTLAVRKTIGGLDRPFDVAITPRQQGFGFARNVYFAYILERSGHVSLFESGPFGVNGWGYDDVVLRSSFSFDSPQGIQPDPRKVSSGVWILHDGQLDPQGQPTGLLGGAASLLVLDSTTVGQIPLVVGDPPNPRGLSFAIEASLGSDTLSGTPSDLAFDDQRNLGALPNLANPFSAGAPTQMNGKGLVRQVPLGPIQDVVGVNDPCFLFLSIPSAGVVDVIDLDALQRVDTNVFVPGVQSIDAPGAEVLMDYFRQ